MKIKKLLMFTGIFSITAIYLFATAPQPLEAAAKSQADISIEKALQIINKEHANIRELYTKEIVGQGFKRGLKFQEEWEEEEVVAAPLPAQFLREIARSLEQSSVPLGLYLASDFAINKANILEGEQLQQYKKLSKDRTEQFSYLQDIQRYTLMVPDVAIGKPCVQCHNDHKDSPKTDWKLGEIMGATTWSYPNETISYEELFAMLNALHQGVRDAYSRVIEEFNQLPMPPTIGPYWPADDYALPDMETFMAKIETLNAKPTLKAISNLSKQD